MTLVWLAGLAAAGMCAHLALCVGASYLHFRRSRKAKGPPKPMTLIRPIRGADPRLEYNLEALAAADPGKTLQILLAIETPEDSAAPIAEAFAGRHKDRDIQVVYTGPAGKRMGKMHNMIEALKKARHPKIIFTDADVQASPAVLAETSWALENGYDAAFGLPYHSPAEGLGAWCFMAAFNHSFCLPAALTYYLGSFQMCAGGWMAYSRRILDKIGGLERFERAIADDFALSRAAARAGARKYLLKELVWVQEQSGSLAEDLKHLAKWASIICWTIPRLYLALPPVFLAGPAIAGVLWWAGEPGLGALVWGGLMAARVLAGLVQDATVAGIRMPWWGYPLLAFVDVGSFFFWLAGWRRTILWRGRTYRLERGGRCTVINDGVRNSRVQESTDS